MLNLFLVATLLTTAPNGDVLNREETTIKVPEIHLADGSRDVNAMVDLCRKMEKEGKPSLNAQGNYDRLVTRCEVV